MIRLYNKRLITTVFIFLITAILTTQVWSQKENVNPVVDELVQYIEKIYGQDDLIFQGRFFRDTKPLVSGNPYFSGTNWQDADIFIRERSFNNVPVLYDIFNDDIIIQASYEQYMKLSVSISNDLIDSFRIANHLFFNLRHELKDNKETYYEKIYQGNREYLLHYNKYVIDNHYSSNAKGSYSEMKSNLYIVNNEDWVKCPGKSAFLQYFGSKKRSLRKFMRRQHIQYKKAGFQELQKLCKFADKQLNE